MESKATTEISQENEDDRVTQPWNSTRPVKSTQLRLLQVLSPYVLGHQDPRIREATLNLH